MPETIFTPEWVKEATAAMTAEVTKRNTLSIEEFAKFRPLYSSTLREGLSQEYLKNLSWEFRETVSLFDPITIVIGNHKVVLPPMVDSLNLVPGAGAAIQNFMVALNGNDAAISIDPELNRDKVIRLLLSGAKADPKSQAEYDQMMDDLVNPTPTPKAATPTAPAAKADNVDLSQFDWN